MRNKKDDKKVSKNIYVLPFNNKLALKPEPAPSHKGPMINALDFSMEEGTPVYAAADGVVVQVKDDSKKGEAVTEEDVAKAAAIEEGP